MDRGDGASSVLRSYDDATLPMSSFKYAVDVGKKHTRTDGWTRVFMQEQYHNICEKPSRIRMGSKNRWRVLADVVSRRKRILKISLILNPSLLLRRSRGGLRHQCCTIAGESPTSVSQAEIVLSVCIVVFM
ncbi:PREDICTED: uncharacterized protein LOC108558585 isoform X1 [Nicrophorus vespilloides]|uniref:Uncharacterized protein LOC108558585 isoform X1 n=1 Tax=Nicrophorus vespilloides TaxID=110193 RepID=A0ABM1M8Y6_NICVS|nr:PREDICTED: uncharacterized protein LOC108558585 isoform X1 [Nicrophorus vespilloides]